MVLAPPFGELLKVFVTPSSLNGVALGQIDDGFVLNPRTSDSK
jgi:hypothetical protein